VNLGREQIAPLQGFGFLCALTVVLTVSLAACGGGGSPAPPSPPGNFTLASLKGQYAFSLSGVDTTGAYIARMGSFTSDGAGNIISGLEDVLPLGTGVLSTVNFTGGSYQIQSTGRGTMTFQTSGGVGLQVIFDMQSPAGGFLIQSDKSATSSGTFSLQTPSGFANGSLLNQYVFTLSGISFSNSSVGPISMVGEINSDGNGNITGGLMDTNDGNFPSPATAVAIAPGTYQLDTNGNGTNFGRGTMSFAGRDFVFYIVDAAHILLLEEDALGGSAGHAVQQTAPPTQNSQFAGSFIFEVAGAGILGSKGPVVTVGRFTADGKGGLTAVTADDNNDGTHVHIKNGSNVSNATYSIDTDHAGSGRGTFSFTNGSTGTYSFTFYAASASQAFVQDTSKGYIAAGPLSLQGAGPFSLTNLAGDYVFNWGGVHLGTSTAVPLQEDYAGQYTLANANSNNISGVADFMQLGLSSSNLYGNISVSGKLTIQDDGTADNAYTFVLNSAPSTTLHFQVYFGSNSTAYLVCTDSSHTVAGAIRLQAP